MMITALSCPDSPLGWLICEQDLVGFGQAATDWAIGHRVSIVAALVGAVILHCGWRLARYMRWNKAAGSAQWLEITPPASTTLGSTIELWRLLAALLPADGVLTLRPYRLMWEVHAAAEKTRVGLWIPVWMNSSTVASVVQRAWPGARARLVAPPRLRASAAVRELRPRDAEWLPFTDATGQDDRTDHDRRDRSRAVFDALGSVGRGGEGLLQVVVVRAPKRRSAVMCRAALRPASTHLRGPLAADMLVRLLRGCLLTVLDLFSRTTAKARPTADGALAERQRRVRLKVADPPHFLISIRIAAAAPNRKAARAAVDDITGGFTLISPHLVPGHVSHRANRCRSRWSPAHRMFLASVSEVATVTRLPGDPAVHGLPAAAARRRAASTETWSPTERR